MGAFNRVTLIGRIVRGPKRLHGLEAAWVTVILEVIETSETAAGTRLDEINFVDVILLGEIAEHANERLKVGAPIVIEGRLQCGRKRSRLRVIAERLVMLAARSGPMAATSGGAP